MKGLNTEMTGLLDKLYNLRGEDSVVLVSMEKEKAEAEETREKTSSLKAELQSKINELTTEENVLEDQGEKLKKALETIKKDDFSIVIERLNIEFDPEAIRSKIEDKLPSTLERVASEKKDAASELVRVEEEMNDAITKIEELGIRKDEAISNQERLNRYFDLALSSNINITRDEITSLLEKFNFNEEEQREAAKLLMFPEDGLFEYDNNKKNVSTKSKSISEVIQEAKEVAPVIKEEKIEEVKLTSLEDAKEEVKETASKEITKEELINKLTELGFDYLDFTNNDFAKILNNYDEATLVNNIKLIRELKINNDIFNDNVELFYDKELNNKLEMLKRVGKQAQDIYLNPNVLVKYNYNELESAIRVLNESGLDPRNVPLMAY
jgi:hypothetical protein